MEEKYDYGVIYCLTSPNGKKYIGQTKSISHRLACHKISYRLKNPTKISNAIKKYGFENFKVEILCKCSDKKDLNDRERHCIKIFDTIKNGYNISLGGHDTSPSKESIEKGIATRRSKNNGEYCSYYASPSQKVINMLLTYIKIGKEHKSYNHTIYNFVNRYTNEKYTGTFNDIKRKFNLTHSSMSNVIHGKDDHHKGWQLEATPIPKIKVYNFINTLTGEIFKGSKIEFYKKYNFPEQCIFNLVKGKNKSYKKWIVKNEMDI